MLQGSTFSPKWNLPAPCNIIPSVAISKGKNVIKKRRRGHVLKSPCYSAEVKGQGPGVPFSSPSWRWTLLLSCRDVWPGGSSGWRPAGPWTVKIDRYRRVLMEVTDVTQATICRIHTEYYCCYEFRGWLEANSCFKDISYFSLLPACC